MTKSGLAHDWALAVADLAPAGTTRAEVELHLRGHLEALHDALLAEPFRAEPGRRIGAELIDIHLRAPVVLESTVVILADRLLDELGLDTYTFQPSLNRILAAIAHGYTRTLRDRVLTEQEQVYSAALAVHRGPSTMYEPGPPPAGAPS
jgi:hypothetical protein